MKQRYILSDSTEEGGSTDLTLWHMHKLAHRGQHGTGGGVWYLLLLCLRSRLLSNAQCFVDILYSGAARNSHWRGFRVEMPKRGACHLHHGMRGVGRAHVPSPENF